MGVSDLWTMTYVSCVKVSEREVTGVNGSSPMREALKWWRRVVCHRRKAGSLIVKGRRRDIIVVQKKRWYLP